MTTAGASTSTCSKPASPSGSGAGSTGALLVDLRDELDLPPQLRIEWRPLIDHTRNGPKEDPISVGVDEALKDRGEDRLERIAAHRAAARAKLQQ